MNTITAKPNQSGLDIVLMACGTMEGAMAFMSANDAGITDNTNAGDQFTIPVAIATDISTLQYLQQNQVMIGTKG